MTSLIGSATVDALAATDTDAAISAMEAQEQQTQQAISNLEKQTKETQDAINAVQGQKAETEKNVSDLQSHSANLQSTINGYEDQLDDINDQISEAESAMAEISAEIVALNTELEEARANEAEQYALLKKQLQSTYEAGGTDGMLMMLFTCGSIQEFLTKSEYVSSIVTYDQQKLVEYRELEADIEAKVAEVEAKQDKMDEYQDQLDSSYDELADLTDEVMGDLNDTNSSISSQKLKLADYNAQLSSLDSKMKGLESQVAAAQAALAQQIAERQAALIAAGKTENLGGSYSATDNELQWLAATIQAEAGGESYTGKLAVGTVIMNRVKSSSFPNTVVGVITQNMQFASYRSGKVELIISQGPNSTCLQAAQEVLNGYRVGNYLFFMTKYYADYYGISEYTMIGNHAFFYRWVTNKSTSTESTSTDSSTDTTEDADTSESTDGAAEETEEEETTEQLPEMTDEQYQLYQQWLASQQGGG